MPAYQIEYPVGFLEVHNGVLPTKVILTPTIWLVSVYARTRDFQTIDEAGKRDNPFHMTVFRWYPQRPKGSQSEVIPPEKHMLRRGGIDDDFGYIWLTAFLNDGKLPELWTQTINTLG